MDRIELETIDELLSNLGKREIHLSSSKAKLFIENHLQAEFAPSGGKQCVGDYIIYIQESI